MTRITIDLISEKKKKQLLKLLEDLNIPYLSEDNPSPSGDSRFMDHDNIEILAKGISDERSGRISRIRDPNNPWESIL